ncbi:hypothetical protein H9655_04790 [Cytobacillus sp. Sa5YUA1]|uniref:Uncharacterized protein n=1 Tax=Cytobacillus stercorigallinarum TaxID=2762240 RepID=A0ABR8QLE4_9BACI|nr:hypothetical protein [Cytobacillus stercorigallinarum]MBD7936334.1 hypothetical protein [Cytobacillus stercorigallinarum]
MNKDKIQSILSYIMNLLTTLTCLLMLLHVFLLTSVGFDLYEWKQSYQSWVYLYCIIYALLVAVIIDEFSAKFSISLEAQTIFYTVAGFGAFFPLTGFTVFTVLAGMAAAIVAGIFFICYRVVKHYHKKLWAIVLLLPVLFALSTIDYTEKKDWHEQTSENSFSAQFAHFNGMHSIPITLARGEKVNMTIHFSPENEGGYGYYILDGKGQDVFFQVIEANDQDMHNSLLSFKADTIGDYRVIVTGSDVKGRIKVNWEVE